MFLDDDGAGNVRLYYLSSGIRTYINETQGTINYLTGQITLNSLNVDLSQILEVQLQRLLN